MAFRRTEAENSERIVRRKLSDEVRIRLQEMIARGELKPGDYMPSERALMERFGVGRPAVREALQSLAHDGLITINHGERSRIQEVTANTVFGQSEGIARLFLEVGPANLEHLKQARTMVELGLVRAAVEAATDVDTADLRDLLAGQEAALPKGATPFIAADIRFHVRLAEITGNPIITAASEAMLNWLFEYHTSLLHWSGNEDRTLREHAEILRQIEGRDADAAVMAMRVHLDRSAGLYNHRDHS